MTVSSLATGAIEPAAPITLDARTQRLLESPVIPLLVRLAWPNVIVMLAQASTGLVETFWVGRLGVDALAGMALVFPGVMLMQMISGGAMGGGISAAIARALGSRRRDDANALVIHALIINGILGAFFAFLVLTFGEPLYRVLGGTGGSLRAALIYSNIVFAGNIFLWFLNALASALRGTGNMIVPGLVIGIGALFLIPISPLLIFGLGPFPALGIAGGGVALLLYYVIGSSILAAYIWRGKSVVLFRRCQLKAKLFYDILKVGAVGSISSLQTNLVVAVTTGMVGAAYGPKALAGYGTGARLEYLLVPVVFGVGAPLVAMVGTSIGAGDRARALKVAFVGSLFAFCITEFVGVLCAIFPKVWLGLFSQDEEMLATGTAYLHAVGPFYGFFGLGLALYFASQGAGKLFWPLVAGAMRVVVAIGGAAFALHAGASPTWVFLALGLALLVYGCTMATSIWSGGWFKRSAPTGTLDV